MCALAYINGEFRPLDEVKVGIQTHALHYGTGCFEGIRGYWNEEKQDLVVFRMREHYQRLQNSAKLLRMTLPHSVDELCNITIDLLARDGWKEDVYIRPILFKSTELLGVRLHKLQETLAIYALVFGKYLSEGGVRCCVSSWRRIQDNSIPARAKITGGYVNSALCKSEAIEDGFDEGIMLTETGHVSEGSGENIFLIMNGKAITPAISENILPGITRDALMTVLRQELGVETIERQVGRSELYTADEVFLCGTAAEVTPVLEIDRRPVGSGQTGPITSKLQSVFFKVVKGCDPKYANWCSPVYANRGTTAGVR